MTTSTASPPVTRAATEPKPKPTADQTLCAAAYVWPGLAKYVRDKLHDDPATAWAPSTTIDVLALARHSAAALRIHRLRNVALLALALVAAAVPTVTAAQFLGPVAALMVAAALVSAWAYGMRTLREGGADEEAETGGWERFKRRARWVGTVLAAAFVTVVLFGREPRFWVVVGAFVVAWAVIVAELLWAQHRARLVLGRAGELRDLAPPAHPAVEERIDRLATTNVVAYHSARERTPFVGSGFLVRPWSIAVDVRRGATDDEGKEKVPEEVDVVALYEFLGGQFELEASFESGGSRRLHASQRLYVDGRHIPWDSDLLTGDPPGLRDRLEWSDLAARVRQPDGADDQRVYFCLEEVGRHGAIAVALFVRPYLQGGLLSVDLFPHVMPPLDKEIETTVAALPDHPFDRLKSALDAATRGVPGLILSSPAECAGEVWRVVRLHRDRRRWRRAARRRRPFDFGALISLREGVSQTNPKALSLFVTSDLARLHAYLLSRVLSSVKEFLDRRGIDTHALEDSAKKTVNNVNWNVGDVRGDMISFGNHNTLRYKPGQDDDEDRREKR